MNSNSETTSPESGLSERRPSSKKQSDDSSASRENVFGGMLLFGMFLIVVALVGGGGWYGYQKWCAWRSFDERMSITQLPDFEPPQETLPSPEPSPAVSEAADKKESLRLETPVSVLNGGAPKGSAATLAETIKKEGFTKVTTGNTVGDYAGTSVYYADGYEPEAKVLHKAITAKYPQATLLPSDTKNKDTAASLTVVVGK